MQYREYELGPSLRGRACLWRLTADRVANPAFEAVLPDGCVELIVHLGDPFECEREGKRERQPRVLVAGPGTAPIRLAPTGRVDVLGVRLEAGVAAELVETPLVELVDRIPSLDELAPRFARGLGDELASTRAHDEWRAVLERRLAAALEHGRQPSKSVAFAVGRLRATSGRLSISALAGELGQSTRQLERAFRERVGLSPKTFARLVRFQRALALLRRPGASLARISAGCGYFDQAHLVRDFRQFAGTSPGRFRASEHELAEHFVAGEP